MCPLNQVLRTIQTNKREREREETDIKDKKEFGILSCVTCIEITSKRLYPTNQIAFKF